MSIAGYSDQGKMHKKSFHQRNDSGELDVFEAARYFSGYSESVGHHGADVFPQKVTREDRQAWRGGRISLDMPMRNALPAQSHVVIHDKQIVKDHKKYKQPSSPGGRLASFLNSLFNQTASKKKKSIKSGTTQSMKDHEEDQSPGGGGGGRRKRRSSISHFRISTTTTTTATTNDSKSLYSSSSSGFRTPPPYANTPTKAYKDLRSYSDHKQTTTLSKNNNGQVKSIVALRNEVLNDKTSTDNLDDKFKFINGLSEKNRKLGNEKSDKDRIWVDRYPSEEKEFRMFTNDPVDEDGADSDSSSDLFELQNYDLGCCYSSGNLPVYETTNMESIKRGAPISSGII